VEKKYSIGVNGVTIPPGAPNPETEIKAVTFHQLKILSDGEGYSTRIIFDI
jgi:SHS2 domain-containing protein